MPPLNHQSRLGRYETTTFGGEAARAFVPPPPQLVLSCLDDLERFLHADTPELPTLVKAGLVHVQFEIIHPFKDGNSRPGRLLITFLLCAEGMLREPILYLSLYLKTHRQTYYDLLQRVRDQGDWEAWLRFFLDGVAETAEGATFVTNDGHARRYGVPILRSR